MNSSKENVSRAGIKIKKVMWKRIYYEDYLFFFIFKTSFHVYVHLIYLWINNNFWHMQIYRQVGTCTRGSKWVKFHLKLQMHPQCPVLMPTVVIKFTCFKEFFLTYTTECPKFLNYAFNKVTLIVKSCQQKKNTASTLAEFQFQLWDSHWFLAWNHLKRTIRPTRITFHTNRFFI